MTIAISLKVNDGLVLATDSAATIFAQAPDGNEIGVMYVYENAEKLFNLCKGYPIGVITWGSGAIGQASISSLTRDFRKKLKKDLSPDANISIEEISKKFSEYIYKLHDQAYNNWQKKPSIGFIVAGYSTDKDFAEEWLFEIVEGKLNGPTLVRGLQEIGMIWNGETEAIFRLLIGYSNALPFIMKEVGIDDISIEKVLSKARERLTVPFVVGAMPIQDAIDLAEFFVGTTINYSKFSPGATTVGGPIDIASITKHEGFKWVKRKYYYNRDINPEVIMEQNNYDHTK